MIAAARRFWPSSLRLRLLGATLFTLALALTVAHAWLGSLFRDHVLRQTDATLVQQLDQLTARLDFDALGQPVIDPRSLSDPRWDKPFSGLYWQLDAMSADGHSRVGVLRSRSLWDTQLSLTPDRLADGDLHMHDSVGPQGLVVRVVERSLQVSEQPQARWRLMVAADTREALAAVDDFNGVLAASLAGLGLLLALAALAQVAVGLSPLQTMQRALHQVREGRSARLDGRFPAEVQPLIDDFNSVLDRNTEVVERARTQAGNLAHALKTPLAVLGNAAAQAPRSDLAPLVAEQVQVAQRHIHWHLARARAAASQGLPGQRTPLAPLIGGLLRVMSKLHAARALDLDGGDVPVDWAFAGEEQDLQEMLGNLLDNACRSARSAVRVRVRREGAQLQIEVDDDGPGIPPEQRAAVLQRGVRLDESGPGSGLGLAIVVELAALYGGALTLEASVDGGLRACLTLPAAA
ncbi:MAG TPA: HAMP domain-containing sensor histidine kinase [Hydrogenophaga sp.]|uniref:HAMP domain-containing sensor histidine kinase n=1 Tax=Hydrogenophaga sp. TaxID=1904254 RepID=UPI002CB38C1A|nr:HAMP domain-containing sensor histidine kinase [Hydrogenophaga sp.]HMN94381.1 HAMP domain-containing sensor histidine kinase [Hydrogenophaga sp.]HMP10991.1 HAMP domain-containing sensor histidine kinase [Hydrogenophaga sp.]